MDLTAVCGLPVFLRESTLELGPGVTPVVADVRRLEDMREVLYNQTVTGPRELYYMYRGVSLTGDAARLAEAGLRFDITVLRPEKLGPEYLKTAGHYHPQVPGSDLTYPELYYVLHGHAHYLLQRPGPDPARVEDVVIVDARAGDWVLVPPGYGHITINPGPGPLVMANWVEAGFHSVYEPIRRLRGGAYYEVEQERRGVFIDNEHYAEVPVPRLAEPGLPAELGLPAGPPYACDLERLTFLRDPAPWARVLARAVRR